MFNFISIGFTTVGYNTTDIQQIKISGDGVGWGEESFSIWAGAPAVVEGSDAYIYWDASMDPNGEATDCYWGDDQCAKANYSIAAGQGVVVQMGAAGLTVQTAGQVPDSDVSVKSVEMFNFLGNPFPCQIDIQNINISGDGVGWGEESFSIWSGAPEVVAGSDAFIYWDASMDPNGEATECYWGDDQCVKQNYQIAAGQSFVIQMGAADLDITIVKPYTLQ